MALELGDEYTYRYGKVHKSIQIVESLPPISFIDVGLTPFVKAIATAEIKAIPDAVEAYREYYRKEKSSFATWKKRPVPDWMKLP